MVPKGWCIEHLVSTWWMPSGELIEPLEGRALMEKDYHCGGLWRFITLSCFLLAPSASCVQLKCHLSVSCPYHHAPLFPTRMDSVPLEPGAQIDPFFLKFFWVMAFHHSSRIHTHLPNFTLGESEERALKQTCGGYWVMTMLGPTTLGLGTGIKVGIH